MSGEATTTEQLRPHPIAGSPGGDREHDCQLYSDCLGVAGREGWRGFSCVACPMRGRVTPSRSDLLELAAQQRTGLPGAPLPRMHGRGADDLPPARAQELRAQLQLEQEQERRATRARVKQENWEAKTAGFWSPVVAEVLAVAPPTPPPARPARELRGPSAPRQRGTVHEDADVELRPAPPGLEVDDEEPELVHQEPPPESDSLVALGYLALAGLPIPRAVASPPLTQRSTVPLTPVKKRDPPPAMPPPLPALEAATAALEAALREAENARATLRLVVARAEEQLAPARAALGGGVALSPGAQRRVEVARTPGKRAPRQPTTIQERLVTALKDGKEHRVADLAAELGEREPAQLAKKHAATKTGRLWRSSPAAAPAAPPPSNNGGLPSQLRPLLADGAEHAVVELAKVVRADGAVVGTALAKMARLGELTRTGRGVYQLARRSA